MIILILIVLGLCLGSFVNALVWRVHKQFNIKKKADKEQYSIVRGRSMCPHCKHELSARDLIPVISWLSLGGKCRYCHKPIEDSPLVEVITAGLFVVSYIYWPNGFTSQGTTLFILWLGFLTGFMALAVYDLKWYLLPNRLVYPLAGLAILQLALVLVFFHGGSHALLAAAYGVLIGGGIFWVLFQISNGKWIGGGDVKLGALLGLIVGGPANSLLLLFLASLLGTIVALPLLLTGKMKRTSRLPFGPFLIAAAIIVYLFGASLIAWYDRIFLLS